MLNWATGKTVVHTKEEWFPILKAKMHPDWKHFGILSEIQMTGKDVQKISYLHEEPETYLKPILFYWEESGRMVDPRDWVDEILTAEDFPSRPYLPWYFGIVKKHGGSLPRFRVDPVPGTGRGPFRVYCRSPKTTNEIRQNADPEIDQFVRGSRKPKNLPSLYDDIFRKSEKSWKSQGKRRHQWER